MTAPNDFAAEQAVLAALAIKPGLAGELQARLPGPECFFHREHAALYSALLALAQRDEGIDRVTVGAELTATGEVRHFQTREQAGEILMEICRRHDTLQNFNDHVAIVRRNWVARALRAVLAEKSDDAGVPGADVQRLLNDLQKDLTGLTALAESRPTQEFGDVADRVVTDTLERVERRAEMAEGATMGLPTGVPGLDEIIGGLQPSNFVIVAAGPGVGKSTVMMQMADAVAATIKPPAGDMPAMGGAHIVSLEMTAAELVGKVLFGEAGIDSQRARAGELHEHHLVRLEQTQTRLNDRRIFIDDLDAPTWPQVRAKIILAREQHGVDVAFVDYLQKIPTPARMKKRDHVAEIAQGCKSLAKQLGIPIVGLAQLKRRGKAKSPPGIDDLGESSFLERDADTILLLHPRGRPIEQDQTLAAQLLEPEPHVTELLDVIVGKGRHTKTGIAKVLFNKTLGRLVERPGPREVFWKGTGAAVTGDSPEPPEKEPQI